LLLLEVLLVSDAALTNSFKIAVWIRSELITSFALPHCTRASTLLMFCALRLCSALHLCLCNSFVLCTAPVLLIFNALLWVLHCVCVCTACLLCTPSVLL
jgi:hypothetical protein